MLPITSYTLARINLVRAACPFELMGEVDNVAMGKPIIVEKNRKRFGFIEATEYSPAAVIVSGLNLRSRLLGRGIIHAMAFVENGAIDLALKDVVSYSELMAGMERALYQKLYRKDQPGAGQARVTIDEIYPLEHSFVFRCGNQRYMQAYSVSTSDHKVVLNACGSMPMPQVQTGVRYAYAPFRPPSAGMTRGGSRSELMTEIVRNWTNITEAASMYVSSMKSGFTRQLKPAFAPVAMVDQRKSGEVVDRGCKYDSSLMRYALVKAGIDPFEFAKWSVDAQHSKTKTTGSGDEVSRSKFLYAPSSDPSTWKLPVHDSSHIKNALARVNQTQGIPSEAKPALLSKLRKLAKSHGVGVSDKPTSGQKKWAGHRVAATLSAQI